MRKLEEAKFEDTNVALIGTDEDKALRQQAAQMEAEWEGAGKEPGLEVWRVESMAIRRWPERRFGEFYSGDSFIVLRTYRR